MVPVKLISFKEDMVMSEWPYSTELRVTNIPPNTEWAEDGRILFKERDKNTRVLPIIKFSEHFNVPSLGGVSNVVDTYFSCDFNSSPFIKGCIEYQIKKNTQQLTKELEKSENHSIELWQSLTKIKQASWYVRLKWLFTGVKVD